MHRGSTSAIPMTHELSGIPDSCAHCAARNRAPWLRRHTSPIVHLLIARILAFWYEARTEPEAAVPEVFVLRMSEDCPTRQGAQDLPQDALRHP